MATFSFTVSQVSVSSEFDLGANSRLTKIVADSGTSSETASPDSSKVIEDQNKSDESICILNTYSRASNDLSVGSEGSIGIFNSWDDVRNNQNGGNTAISDSLLSFQANVGKYLHDNSIESEQIDITLNGNIIGNCS